MTDKVKTKSDPETAESPVIIIKHHKIKITLYPAESAQGFGIADSPASELRVSARARVALPFVDGVADVAAAAGRVQNVAAA